MSAYDLLRSLVGCLMCIRASMFYGVAGVHQRDSSTLSFFNLAEAVMVVELIEELLASSLCTPEEIGVIAPFRKQVYTLRALLREVQLGSIRVGTVDDYQGQEERVMFVSCVVGRNLNKEANDEVQGAMSRIGLMGSDTRFNVAMTRAKALLVVVGDPLACQWDPNFECLLKHCVKKDAYRGCFNPFRKQQESEGLEAHEEEEEGEENVAGAVQRMTEMMLGPAQYDLMFPCDANDLGAYYRDEVEFRVAL
eukprot:TRINITY_DN2630_c0_g1_i8.p1 TRINITY_DN2630_c0_g1~~TRINITY_DN2630_c0_g1_i8.p1  ORF type:complete len:251 (-),score=63.49 TRINITY_DN2630_c0_g1_i8:184-936(-)